MFCVSGSILRAQEYLTLCPSRRQGCPHTLGRVHPGTSAASWDFVIWFSPFFPPGTRQKSLSTCCHYIFGFWFVWVFFPQTMAPFFSEGPAVVPWWLHSDADESIRCASCLTQLVGVPSRETGLPCLVLGAPQAGDGAWWHSFIGQHSFSQAEPVSFQHRDRQEVCWLLYSFPCCWV